MISGELPATKVLMLTGSTGVDDLVDGLGLGADDYMGKPFAFAELVARVRALGRRAGEARPAVLRAGDIELDPARHTAVRAGRDLDLSPKEFGVLEILLGADGATVSGEELLRAVWDEHADPFTNTVRMTMMKLRRKLGDPPAIETVTGAGYRIGPMTVRAARLTRAPYALLFCATVGVLLGASYWLLSRHFDRTLSDAAARDALDAVGLQYLLAFGGTVILALAAGWIIAGRALAPDRPHDRVRPAGVRRAPGRAAGAGGPGRRAARAGRHPRRDAGRAVGVLRRPAPVRGQRRPRAARAADGDPHPGRGHAGRPRRLPRRAARHGRGRGRGVPAHRGAAGGPDGAGPQPARAGHPRAHRPGARRPRRGGRGGRGGPRRRRARAPGRRRRPHAGRPPAAGPAGGQPGRERRAPQPPRRHRRRDHRDPRTATPRCAW